MYWIASATLDRLSGASLVGVDDLDAVAGPAERDGHVGQGILARGRLLVLGHLLGARLADIDDGLAIEVMVADLGGARRQQVGRQGDGARRRGGRRRAEMDSGVLMPGLLPHRGWEALGDDLAEHQQDFPTPRRGEARPGSGQRPASASSAAGAGGTVERRVWDMVALRAIGRAIRRTVTGTTAPAAAARSH